MISEKNERDSTEDFLRLMLIGELFSASGSEDKQKYLEEILRKCGVIPDRSDFLILDHCRIGNSTITIARYTLYYTKEGDVTSKSICIEGSVTMESDDLGERYIRICSKTDPVRDHFDTANSGASMIRGKI